MINNRRVAVVGGGITGLAAALQLKDRVEVQLFEAQPLLGGKIRSGSLEGVDIEFGADSFLTRVPWAVDLIRELGLEMVEPITSSASIVHRGALRQLPTGPILGLPSSLKDLAESGILTRAEAARAASRDLLAPRLRLSDATTIADAVSHRLGRAVLERFTDPLLSGIYAGNTNRLSLSAAAPQLAEFAATRRRWLRERSSSSRPSRSPFGSTEGGLSTLIDAIAAGLGGRVHLRHPIDHMTAGSDGFRLSPGPEQAFDAVIVTTPAFDAARLLSRVSAEASTGLQHISYASVALVCLAFEPGTSIGDGSGFLVPRSEGSMITACTYFSNKWGRPPGAPVIARCSVGRSDDETWTSLDDASLTARVVQELKRLRPFEGRLMGSKVVRWTRSLPQYEPGHGPRVRQIRAALPSGLEVTGAAFEGVGLAACVRQGREAADRVISSIG